jgi:hypothetical protein
MYINFHSIISIYKTLQLFSKLRWDNFSTRRKKRKTTLMFKTNNELTPHIYYLRELFESRSTGFNLTYLRNSENTLFVPKLRTNYMVNEVLVTTGQCCGMSYLIMYEQYALL